MEKLPTQIEVRGARVHNLKNIDVDIPLHKFVAISGLSGSGKSSLAMGILYEEGSRRYLEALSTYTRRRIKIGAQAEVTSVKNIPSALALKQRPSIPSERATVGTMSEIFNVIRLIFSRLGSPVCPNGHRLKPSLEIAQVMSTSGDDMGKLTCPECGAQFYAFSAEDFAFNSAGACTNCQGTGQVRTIDDSKLIGDENLSLADGAVASWHLPGRNFMPSVAEQAGVRIHVPYKDLTDKEKDFVLNGPERKFKMDFRSGTGRVFHDFNALYENAHAAVLRSAQSSKSERAQKRISEFFHYSTCPVCHGTRLKPELLKQLAGGLNIAQVSELTLVELKDWQQDVLKELPSDMHKMAQSLFKEFTDNLRPLLELGLDYLTLSRNGNTLSTGELQRIQLSRTLRTQTTGVLYILDEPSIGLHSDNITGLLNVFRELVHQGNSLVVVDHNVDIIKAADWIIEMGPGSGNAGGQVIAQGTPDQVAHDDQSKIGPYLNGTAKLLARSVADQPAKQQIDFDVQNYFNLKNVHAQLPVNRLSAITGFSGAGKTSLILDSLVPAIQAQAKDQQLPKQGACPTCGGAGVVTLDIQFLPDMQQVCPECNGDRYNQAVQVVKWHGYSIVDILKMDVREALSVFEDQPRIEKELQLLQEVGLDYLHLGESTPSLSGGEAQRLKLVKHLNRNQATTLFVFDEPTIGLHPLDVKTLVNVMQQLLDRGATIITITHDLNLIANADYLLDLGPRGGKNGGRIVASGQPQDLVNDPQSLTIKYLADYLKRYE